MMTALPKFGEKRYSRMGDDKQSPKPADPISLPDWVRRMKPARKTKVRRTDTKARQLKR
jgi:hypothetical protein